MASVVSSVPDVLRTSTKSLSYCVVVVVSLDETFNQNLRLGEPPDGIETCWYAAPELLFALAMIVYPVPLCGKDPVLQTALPESTHGAVLPSKPPLVSSSPPPPPPPPPASVSDTEYEPVWPTP